VSTALIVLVCCASLLAAVGYVLWQEFVVTVPHAYRWTGSDGMEYTASTHLHPRLANGLFSVQVADVRRTEPGEWKRTESGRLVSCRVEFVRPAGDAVIEHTARFPYLAYRRVVAELPRTTWERE